MLYSKAKRDKLKKTIEFKNSNKIWNDLKLNHGFIVGYLIKLLNRGNCSSFKSWEKYYFQSGAERKKKLKTLPPEIEQALINFDRNVPKKYYTYNTDYGRTYDDLLIIAKKLDKNIHVGLELSFNFVYIRIIDETWIGYLREKKAFNQIEKYLSLYNLSLNKANYTTDIYYGVDFEIKNKGVLLAGVQIKSTNFLANKAKLRNINEITLKKNKLYEKEFNVPVYFIYIDEKLNVVNMNDLYFKIIRKLPPI